MTATSDFKNLPGLARWTIILFSAAGIAAVLYAMAFQPNLASNRIFLLLALAAGSAQIKVKVFRQSTLSLLTSVVLLSVIHEGPAIAVLVAVWGVTIQTIFPSKRIVLHQLAFNSGMIAITVAISWITYHALAAASWPLHTLSAEVIATVVASFTYFLSNSISVSLILALTKGMSAFHIWFNHLLGSAPSFMLAGLLSLTLAGISGSAGFFLVAVLLASIVTAYYGSLRLTAETPLK